MPNRAFKIMPTIKFSICCVTMAEEASSKNVNSNSTTVKCSLKAPTKLQECKNETKKDQEDILRHMCEYCGYRTRIRENLRVHKRRHTGEKPFSCDICHAKFVARYQLTTHYERHKDAQQRRKRYMCEECNVGFLSARALYHHRPLHATVKQYKCTLCDKSYAQAAGYAQHKRWHRYQNERVTASTSVLAIVASEKEVSN